MRERGKLFHAIVSLGLAAVGCGGEVSATGIEDTGTRKTDASDASFVGAEDAPSMADGGADTTESSDAETSDFDATTEIDATTARDAAADVAEEFWPPPPIK